MLYRLNKEGMTVVAATPYMDEAELCTRIAFMDQGKIVACASPQELRSQYAHRILELQVDSKNVKPILQHCPIIDINSFGDKYHLVVDDADQAILQVQATLSSAGRKVLSLKEITPTLEDIFVSLAGGGTQYD